MAKAMTEAEIDRVAMEVLEPLEDWAFQCHAASSRLVKSGRFGPARVARGSCTGVRGQHSWLVLGMDCYDPNAMIVDPTLWSYDEKVVGVWIGSLRVGRHHPHGQGSIWGWGRPVAGDGPVIELTPLAPLSVAARVFLELLGPLDRRGWQMLASDAPVEGWPAGEILAAMDDTRELSALVPIDRLGMLTDRNPGGVYLP